MTNRELAKVYLSKVDGENFSTDGEFIENIEEVLKSVIINMSKQTFPDALWDIVIGKCLGKEGLKTGMFRDGFTAFGKYYCRGSSVNEFLDDMEEYAIFDGEMKFVKDCFQLTEALLNGIDMLKIVTDDSYFEAIIEMAESENERNIWGRLWQDPNVFLVLYKKQEKVKFMIPFSIERINGEPTLLAKLGSNSLLERIAKNTMPRLEEILALGSENHNHICVNCGRKDLAKHMEYMSFSDSYICSQCLTKLEEGELSVHFSVLLVDNSIEALRNGLIGANLNKTVEMVKSAHKELEDGDNIIFKADAIELEPGIATGNWNLPLKLEREGCTLTEKNFYFGDVVPSILDDILHDIYRLPITGFGIIVSGSLEETNYEYVMRQLSELQFAKVPGGRVDSLSIHSQCLEIRGLNNEY